MKKFCRKPIFIAGVSVIIAIVGIYFYFRNGENGSELVVVKKGDIVSEVSVTCRIKPFKNVDLAFEKSGRVSSVLADVGNFVYAGQPLVKEDSSELQAQLSKAKADLASGEAELNKSKIILGNYYSSIIDVLNDAYIKADDAVKKQADAMFTDGESDTPKLNFSTMNSQAQTDSQNGRLSSRAELASWRQEFSNLSAISSRGDLDSALEKSQEHLSKINSFLISTMDALNKTYGLTQSTLDSYKTNITTARTNVNAVLTNIADQKQDIDSQKATVDSDEAAGESYKAAIQNIEAQISKTVLYSPINGVVTKQDAKVGEIAVANTILVSVIFAEFSAKGGPAYGWEVEANIPEVDIAKVKISSPAAITLDAYGNNVVFDAKVLAIDPAETVIEDVATYKTTLQFLKEDERIKSGMTGNADILYEKRSDVLVIPNRLVNEKNGKKFVTIIENGNQREIMVKTGLRGTDGNIEILEGLKEGDKVIISVK